MHKLSISQFPKNWCVSLVLLFAVITASNGYKVLVVAPRLGMFQTFEIISCFNSYDFLFILGTSHFLFMSEFVKALLDRGHEVTFITIFSLNHLNLTNYTEISINIQNRSDTESKCQLLYDFFV